MKKLAFFLIVFALISRVVCCGQKVSQSASLNQLENQRKSLTADIAILFSQSSHALSVTNLSNLGASLTELNTTVSYNKTLTIAQSY